MIKVFIFGYSVNLNFDNRGFFLCNLKAAQYIFLSIPTGVSTDFIFYLSERFFC